MRANSLKLIFGNQLFSGYYSDGPCLMIEDRSIAQSYRYHQTRILHQFVCMREFRDELKKNEIQVDYFEYPESLQLGEESFFARVESTLKKYETNQLITCRIPDVSFREKMIRWATLKKIDLKFEPSPQFMVNDDFFTAYLSSHKKPFMKTFYERVRLDHKILLTENGKPAGGQWSFDTENRKKLAKNLNIPPLPRVPNSKHFDSVQSLIKKYFSDHPGTLPNKEEGLWIPSTRKVALLFLQNFLEYRFEQFGPYEDALSSQEDFIFHSALSPLLNIGLLNPLEVVEEALRYAEKNRVPLASLEGFIRQILGWREFVHGIHQNFHSYQSKFNYFGHRRTMKECWYDGSTGLPPLDDSIKKANRLGYNHHIERLMVLSSTMLMTELDPREVHRWFMEMYLDSYEWVMGPNVYGMGQFSDGGIFATKPYVSGSNYILKMSSYPKGEWCEIWDGLYWSFIEKNRDTFSKNPRMAMIAKLLDKMDLAKKQRIFTLADRFKDHVSTAAS